MAEIIIDTNNITFVEVVLRNGPSQSYTYLILSELLDIINIGSLVLVNFANRDRMAIVTKIGVIPDYSINKIKPIIKVVESKYFSEELLRSLIFASSYYVTHLGKVLFTGMPAKLSNADRLEKVKVIQKLKITDLGIKVLDLYNSNSLKESKDIDSYIKEFYNSTSNKILNKIKNQQKVSKGHIYNKLLSSNLIYLKDYIETDNYKKIDNWFNNIDINHIVNLSNKLILNDEQKLACDTIIRFDSFASYVLDGITGSGKTEVYLQVIEYYLKKGKTALILVPEIGLTPQTTKRFLQRFNVPIEIIHSNVSDRQRLLINRRIRQQQCAIVIGTRSAIFSDLYNLGIIIIDEEHDSSYKQQNDFRYNARDIAIFRASQLNIPIIMGSATPMFSTIYNILNGKFKHLILSKKAVAKYEPVLSIININTQKIIAGITEDLFKKIKLHTDAGNQVFLFLNRRGFATVFSCEQCGYEVACPGCGKPFVYHRKKNVLICHQCDIIQSVPNNCSNCGSNKLVLNGVGTEQIENFLLQYYKEEEIVRIDRDTVSNQNKMNDKLELINSLKAKILIGTQMLAKGHHFPNVTLAAIINIDGLLFSDSLRSPELLSQIYLQVSGRAGRAEKIGEIVLQTRFPNDNMFNDLFQLSYFEFAKKYINLKSLVYNNRWVYQANIVLSDTDDARLDCNVRKVLSKLEFIFLDLFKDKNFVADKNSKFSIVDLGKLSYRSRLAINLSFFDRSALNKILHNISPYLNDSKINFYIDVDPYI